MKNLRTKIYAIVAIVIACLSFVSQANSIKPTKTFVNQWYANVTGSVPTPPFPGYVNVALSTPACITAFNTPISPQVDNCDFSDEQICAYYVEQMPMDSSCPIVFDPGPHKYAVTSVWFGEYFAD